MTAEELARLLGREGDGVGCTRVSEGIVQIKLGDDQWYAFADALEFVHRHMKHLDEGE